MTLIFIMTEMLEMDKQEGVGFCEDLKKIGSGS